MLMFSPTSICCTEAFKRKRLSICLLNQNKQVSSFEDMRNDFTVNRVGKERHEMTNRTEGEGRPKDSTVISFASTCSDYYRKPRR